jgi:hypothetical protein
VYDLLDCNAIYFGEISTFQKNTLHVCGLRVSKRNQ